ncbi:hypothetical protein GGR57DRAFT_520869 [Xylariaceae sp. FL1272]|nr:hypothetical protein GGR57DRAFT_520869 [Xylariaceae sp. FL1272]
MAGETAPDLGSISFVVSMITAGFFAISVYNSVEILIFQFRTFSGPCEFYFWSLLCANTGIASYSVFALLWYFRIAPSGPMSVFVVLGSWLMVSGQSLVLCMPTVSLSINSLGKANNPLDSRLYLVVGEPLKLRWVLVMIFFVFFALQLPTSILFMCSNFNDGQDAHAATAFRIYEKIQVAAFTIQESIISGLYVHEASSALKPVRVIKGDKVTTGKSLNPHELFESPISRELIALFILVIALDISLSESPTGYITTQILSLIVFAQPVIVEYTNHFQVLTTYKPLVYSIKLKIISIALNDLLNLVKSGTCSCQLGSGSSSQQQRITIAMEDTWWSQHCASLGIIESDTAGGGSISQSQALSPLSTPIMNNGKALKEVTSLG